MLLGFLNLGPSEVTLILVLFILLFGAQRIPELARSLGRARSELEKAQREVREAITPEEDKALAEQLAFERMREAHMRAQVEDPELAALVKAADELGLVTAGKGKEELRADIAAKVSARAEAEEGSENRAAGAQR